MEKTTVLRGKWIIKARREDVYAVVSDFERMPERFPAVAERMSVVSREGDRLELDAVARSFGRSIAVRMHVELLPGKGFISDNASALGMTGHERFFLHDHPEGTLVDYRYEVTLRGVFWCLFGKPLIEWYAMRYWKRAFIDRLRALVEHPNGAGMLH